MEKIHDHNICPACSANLSGTENNCPFCGYRIIFENKPDSTEEKIEIKITEDQTSSNIVSEEKEEVKIYEAPEITKIEEEGNIETPTKITSENLTTESETIEEKVELDSVENENAEFLKEEISLINDDEAEIEEKKHKKNVILVRIVLAVILVLIVLGALMILHYNNKVDLCFFSKKCDTKTAITNKIPAIEKNYYFGYSVGKINKKNVIVISKLFKLEDKGNNETSATKKYTAELQKMYPKDYKSLKTATFKKFSSIELAYKEKNKIMNNYLKQKYNFRFVEIK
jgi:DNA-directed RNA polymerase subunit RPC12/RpoP